MYHLTKDGVTKRYKLKVTTGIIHFDNFKTEGIQLFPNEMALKDIFLSEEIPENWLPHLNEEERFFYSSYWCEKVFYEKMFPIFEKLNLQHHADSLIIFLNTFRVSRTPIFSPESDLLARNILSIKDFFEKLDDNEFKVLNFKINCIKGAKAVNYKIEDEWLIARFRDFLKAWRDKNNDYDYYIGSSPQTAMLGFDYKKYVRDLRRKLYCVIVDYIYLYIPYKSKSEIFKKTGLIYSEMDDLPSLEYFEKMNARKLKYNNYEEYLGDLVEKIVKRPIK